MSSSSSFAVPVHVNDFAAQNAIGDDRERTQRSLAEVWSITDAFCPARKVSLSTMISSSP